MEDKIILYYRVMRRENFEKATRDLFDLLKTAQVKSPNILRLQQSFLASSLSLRTDLRRRRSVRDVGDYIIGLFEHPVVAPGDGVVASARKVRRLYQFS